MSVTKRILLAILLLSVASLIGYGLYYFFIKTAGLQPNTDQTPSGQTTSSQFPGSGTRPATTSGSTEIPGTSNLPSAGTIQTTSPSFFKPTSVNQLVSETARYSSLNTGGDMRYYNANDGKFYRVLPNGTIEKLSDEVFYNAEKVTWAKNKNQAVIEYPDKAKIVYNFDTKKQVSLPKHWEEFSFSSDGNQIAAKSLGLNPSNRWLATINSDGTGAKFIEPMGENADKVIIDWSPNQQVVAFSQTGAPQGGERREVLFVGLNGENFKSAIVDGSGFLPQWSSSGQKLLYSVYSSRSEFKPELWIVDAQGDNIGNNRKLLQLNTWADKCTFGNDETIYCAVPKDLPVGAGMSRTIANSNYDELYKIDLKTNLKTPISLDGNYTINSIFYDSAKNKLLFTDLNKTGLYQSQL